jgi:predicted CoA-binding protein
LDYNGWEKNAGGEKMTTLKEKVDDFLARKRIAVAGVSRQEKGSAANAIYQKLKSAGYDVLPAGGFRA